MTHACCHVSIYGPAIGLYAPRRPSSDRVHAVHAPHPGARGLTRLYLSPILQRIRLGVLSSEFFNKSGWGCFHPNSSINPVGVLSSEFFNKSLRRRVVKVRGACCGTCGARAIRRGEWAVVRSTSHYRALCGTRLTRSRGCGACLRLGTDMKAHTGVAQAL